MHQTIRSSALDEGLDFALNCGSTLMHVNPSVIESRKVTALPGCYSDKNNSERMGNGDFTACQ